MPAAAPAPPEAVEPPLCDPSKLALTTLTGALVLSDDGVADGDALGKLVPALGSLPVRPGAVGEVGCRVGAAVG
jgi:hypothetical protein